MQIQTQTFQLKNKTPVELRTATVEDAASLLEYLRLFFRESYRNMNHPADYWDQVTIEEEQKVLQDFAIGENKFMLIALINNKIVGQLGCFGMQGVFFKHSARLGMGLLQQCHGLGLGSLLLEQSFIAAQKCGIQRLELTVRTHNTNGVKLYEKMGFQRVGLLQKTALIDNEFCDEWMYEKFLP